MPQLSIPLQQYTPYLHPHLQQLKYFHAPHIPLPFPNPHPTFNIIQHYIHHLLPPHNFPLPIPRHHFLSSPVIKPIYKKYPHLPIIHIHPHTHLPQHYQPQPLSHSTPIP
ncbi:arginase family protein, partial [Priestia megaterium]|uniref:arginase family protein n=1 Tax=Priestia megaterium TaxID=1404 RepID=UPI0039A1429D